MGRGSDSNMWEIISALSEKEKYKNCLAVS